MFTFQFFVSFLAFSALGVFAGPVPEAKRSAQVVAVMDVVNTLQSHTSLILPEINSLVASGIASKNKISPLVSSVVTNLNTANTSLAAITTPAPTDSASNVADVLSAIISDITETLHNAQSAIPGLDDLLEELGVDPAINQILAGVDDLLVGVLNFTAKLLSDIGLGEIAEFLNELAFDLVIQSLGL